MKPCLKIDTKDLSFVKSLMGTIDAFTLDERIPEEIREEYVIGIKVAINEKEKYDNSSNAI